MPIDLILIPNLFCPVWADEGDWAYFTLRATVKQSDLQSYLQGFDGPSVSGLNRAPINVRKVKQEDQSLPDADALVPVPMPDTLTLKAQLLNQVGSGVSPVLQRDYSTFAVMNDYDPFVTINQIMPAQWTILESAPFPMSPKDYAKKWTYSQLLVDQLRAAGPIDGNKTAARGAGSGENFSKWVSQLAAAFSLGNTFRIFTDSGAPLFSVPGANASKFDASWFSQLLLVPDLKPGEPWHSVFTDNPDPRYVLAGVHSLCGLAWPMLRFGDVRTLAALGTDKLPVAAQLTFGGNPEKQSITFDAATCPGGVMTIGRETRDTHVSDPITAYFLDLAGPFNKPPIPAPQTVEQSETVRTPKHLPDINKLVYAVNQRVSLSRDTLLPLGESGLPICFLAHDLYDPSDRQLIDGKASRPLWTTRLSDYMTLSIIDGDPGPQASGAKPTPKLLLALPGRLKPYRRYPSGAGVTKSLLAFHFDCIPTTTAYQSLTKALATGGVRLVADAKDDKQNPIYFNRDDVAANNVYSEKAADGTVLLPVFYFEGLSANDLKALGNRAALVLSIGLDITGDWIPAYQSTFKSDESAQYLWRANLPVSDAEFNAISMQLPDPRADKPLTCELTYKNQFDFYFARSARRMLLPLHVDLPPIPESAFDPVVSRQGLDIDVKLDGWNHKLLNVYLSTPDGTHSELWNPYSIAPPAKETTVNGTSSGVRTRSRKYLFRVTETLSDDNVDPTAPAGPRPDVLILNDGTRIAGIIEPTATGYDYVTLNPLKVTTYPISQKKVFTSGGQKYAYPSDINHAKRTSNWPIQSRQRPPQLLNEARFGKQQHVTIKFEHEYGTEVDAIQSAGKEFDVPFFPWIDWPIKSPCLVSRDVPLPGSNAAADSDDATYKQHMIEFRIKDDSTIRLVIHGEWMTNQTEAWGIDARLAAKELRWAQGVVTILIYGYVFDLTIGEKDGTAHDRVFGSKLKTVFGTTADPCARVTLKSQLAQRMLACVDPGNPALGVIDVQLIDDSSNLPVDLSKASLVEFRLELNRPAGWVAAPDAYTIIRPKLEASATPFQFDEADILDADTYKASFEPRPDLLTGGALPNWLASLKTSIEPIHPGVDESNPAGAAAILAAAKAMAHLTGRDILVASPDSACESSTNIVHSVVPLAFLPVRMDPSFNESTQEVVETILAVLQAYRDLSLSEYGKLSQADLKTRLGQIDLDEASLDDVITTLSAALHPVPPKSPGDANPARQYADLWRDVNAFPQSYAAKLLGQDLNVYTAAKAFVIHVMNNIPSWFHDLRLTKVLDLGKQEDQDSYTYQSTTTGVKINSPTLDPSVQFTATVLDDVNYLNSFFIKSLGYRSAEEMVQTLSSTTGQTFGYAPNSMLHPNTPADPKIYVPNQPAMVSLGPDASVGLVARLAPKRPQIVFEGVLPDGADQSLAPLAQCAALGTIDDTAAGRVAGFNTAYFDQKSIYPQPAIQLEQLDKTWASVVLTLDLDESGEVNKDQIWMRLTPATSSGGTSPAGMLPAGFQDIIKGCRQQSQGFLGTAIDALRGSIAGGLLVWLKDVINRGGAGYQDPLWQAGADVQVLFNSEIGAAGAASVTAVKYNTTNAPLTQVSLFKPRQGSGSYTPRQDLWLLGFETQATAGDVINYSFLHLRDVEYDIDNRFIQMSRPSVQPQAFKVVISHNIANRMAQRKTQGAVSVSGSDASRMSLIDFWHGVQILLGLPLTDLPKLPGQVRACVYRVGKQDSPKYDMAGPSAYTRLAVIREPLAAISGLPSGPTNAFSGIYLPSPGKRYEVDLTFTDGDGTGVLTLSNIPCVAVEKI